MIYRAIRPGRVYGQGQPQTTILFYNNQIVYNSQLSYIIPYIDKNGLKIKVGVLVKDGLKVWVGMLVIQTRRSYAQSLG